jgi:hypothetical protein
VSPFYETSIGKHYGRVGEGAGGVSEGPGRPAAFGGRRASGLGEFLAGRGYLEPGRREGSHDKHRGVNQGEGRDVSGVELAVDLGPLYDACG